MVPGATAFASALWPGSVIPVGKQDKASASTRLATALAARSGLEMASYRNSRPIPCALDSLLRIPISGCSSHSKATHGQRTPPAKRFQKSSTRQRFIFSSILSDPDAFKATQMLVHSVTRSRASVIPASWNSSSGMLAAGITDPRYNRGLLACGKHSTFHHASA